MSVRWLLLCAVVAGNAFAQPIPRTDSGKPDLQGIWQAQNRAAYDLQIHPAAADRPAGTGVVDGGEIPYQPDALAQKQANYAERAALDPLNRCWLPGTPRIMYMDWPFQIFQNDDHVAMTFEWNQVWRLIHTDGEPALYPGIESFMGNSRGRWEGDVLVVTVNDFNDRTWIDGAGNFHSAALQLTERYRMLDADTIEYEVTLEDPEVFTRPWTIRMPLHRQKEVPRLLEYQCQAEASEARGDFERDVRTWYPAQAQPDNQPFDATAGIDLPVPAVTGELARLPDGTPDIAGYYMADAGGANYGLERNLDRPLTPDSRGVVVDPADGILPYQGWARAERIERELPHSGYNDPTAHCFVAGVPRSHYAPAPFQILQFPGYVVVLHERMSWRRIPLVAGAPLPDHIRLWMGDSTGHWEGDTLVVETTHLNGKTWLNEVGDVITHAETVVERFIPVGNNTIIYRATVSDPLAYTRPWTIEMPFHGADDELLEVACLEDNNDLQHLKDVRDEYRAGLNPEN